MNRQKVFRSPVAALMLAAFATAASLCVGNDSALAAARSSEAVGRPLADRAANRPSVVLRDCRRTERPPIVVRPRTISCGTVGAPEFGGLRWRDWGRERAHASGTVVYRDCPTGVGCAAPENYHRVPVRLTVSNVRRCDGRRAYTALRATFRMVDGEPNGYRLDLTDGWDRCQHGALTAARSPQQRHCGSIAFEPRTENGISRIVARGVRCPVARAIARAAEPLSITRGPYAYRVRGFACAGRLDDRYLPMVHWRCARGTATVRFDRA